MTWTRFKLLTLIAEIVIIGGLWSFLLSSRELMRSMDPPFGATIGLILAIPIFILLIHHGISVLFSVIRGQSLPNSVEFGWALTVGNILILVLAFCYWATEFSNMPKSLNNFFGSLAGFILLVFIFLIRYYGAAIISLAVNIRNSGASEMLKTKQT